MPLTFDEIVARCDPETSAFIARRIEQVRQCIQEPDYDPEYDDTSGHMLEEIGDALYSACYPAPDVAPPPLPVFVNLPDKPTHYCRRCQLPRVFEHSTEGECLRCTVCGYLRIAV